MLRLYVDRPIEPVYSGRVDPYRDVAAIERAGPARLIAEPEPPPSRRLRASAFSDGTTRIRIHQGRARVAAFTALGLWWLLMAVTTLTLDGWSVRWLLATSLAIVPLARAAGLWGAVDIWLVDRGVLVHRRSFARTEVYVLDDLDGSELTQLETGSGRIDLDPRDELSFDERSWLGRRLRRAIDDARHARV